MCLAAPARVVQRIDPAQALVEQEGQFRRVSVQLLPEVQVGDYVLLNLGLAVRRLSEEEALEVLDLWRQMALLAAADVEELNAEELNQEADS